MLLLFTKWRKTPGEMFVCTYSPQTPWEMIFVAWLHATTIGLLNNPSRVYADSICICLCSGGAGGCVDDVLSAYPLLRLIFPWSSSLSHLLRRPCVGFPSCPHIEGVGDFIADTGFHHVSLVGCVGVDGGDPVRPFLVVREATEKASVES